MTTAQRQLQDEILRNLAEESTKGRFPESRDFYNEHLRLPAKGDTIPETAYWQALGGLVGYGLVAFKFDSPAPVSLVLTEAGRAAATDTDFTPDYPERYEDEVTSRAPGISDAVRGYVKEALRCFDARCYLAATVMLGLASEAALLDAARALVGWLGDARSGRLAAARSGKGIPFSQTFDEFWTRVQSVKEGVDPTLTDDIDGYRAIGATLKGYRNDAGHPTGIPVARETSFILFGMVPRYLGRVDGLRAFFTAPPAAQGGSQERSVLLA